MEEGKASASVCPERGEGVFSVPSRVFFIVGLLQGFLVYRTYSPELGFRIVTPLLLPLPLYVLRRGTRRLKWGMILWALLLLCVDLGWALNSNPVLQSGYSGRVMVRAAVAGFVILLPSLVLWIERGTAFPEWRPLFGEIERLFWSGILAFVAVCLFQVLLCFAAYLPAIQEIFAFSPAFRSVGGILALPVLPAGYGIVSGCAVGAAALSWLSRRDGLPDALFRSRFRPFTYILFMLPACVFLFFAVLLMHPNSIFSTSISALILSAAMILSALFAHRGGVDEDIDSTTDRPPFAELLIRWALRLVPFLAAYSVWSYIFEYRWKWLIDETLATILLVFLGLWVVAWEVVRRFTGNCRKAYTRVNRRAVPALGLLLLFLVSPLGDVRRFSAFCLTRWIRTESLFALQVNSDLYGLNYLAGDLGIWGYRSAWRLLEPEEARIMAINAVPFIGPRGAGPKDIERLTEWMQKTLKKILEDRDPAIVARREEIERERQERLRQVLEE